MASEAQLAFHRSLYLPSAVKAAAEAYADYAQKVEVSESEVEVLVTLAGWDATDYPDFADDFANHVMFETVVQTRSALGSPA